MRGSPLLRTILMAAALAMTAIGIAQLTRSRVVAAPPSPPESEQTTEITTVETPFFLTLSSPAKEVILESGGVTVEITPDSQEISGSLTLETGHPVVFLTVLWRDPEATPRFAKLRLEPAGIPTQEQTFDSIGELSDVWEPHLH